MKKPRGYPSEMQGKRLTELAKAAGFPSMAEFARAAGIQPGTADKHVQRDSIPAPAAAKYIAAASGTGADIGWLLTGRGHAPMHMSPIILSNIRVNPRNITESSVDEGPPFAVPLWTVGMQRLPGGHVLIAETNELVQAPVVMRNSKSAFAVQAWDDANAPWIRRGSMLFVDAKRIPADGQWCILAASTASEPTTLHKPVLGILHKIEDGRWILQRGVERESYGMVEWPLALLVEFTRHS